MPSLYPRDLDAFRRHLANFDYMQGQDLTDLGDVAVAVQTELGVNPSGAHGTVSARLFHNGNLSESPVGWNRLKYDGNQGIPESLIFAEDAELGGYNIGFDEARMANGIRGAFGENVPGPFGQLQGPVTTGFGANNRGKVPWRSFVVAAESDRAEWSARDGQNAALSDSNTMPCRWGYLLWSLIT